MLPVNVSEAFLEEAEKAGLYLHKRMTIIPIEGKEPNRVNLELGFESPSEIREETFVIRNADNCFTMQYKEFLKDFYLGL